VSTVSPVREGTESAGGVACSRMRRARCGLAAAAAALAAACLSLALAACGDSGDGSATASSGSVVSRQSSTQSSSHSGSQSSSNQNSQSSTQSGGGSISQSSFSTDRGTVQTFGGTSDTTLTVSVDGPSRLLWSNDRGRRFRLAGPGLAGIDAVAGSGELPLARGTHRIAVHGGIWTIVVRPR
jgi:hypothetical protein